MRRRGLQFFPGGDGCGRHRGILLRHFGSGRPGPLRCRHHDAFGGGGGGALRRGHDHRGRRLRWFLRHGELNRRHFLAQAFIDDLNFQRMVTGRDIQYIQVNLIRRFEDPLDLFAIEQSHHAQHFRLALDFYVNLAVIAQRFASLQTFDGSLRLERGDFKINGFFARHPRAEIFEGHRERMFAGRQFARIQRKHVFQADLRPFIEAVATLEFTAHLRRDDAQIHLDDFLQEITGLEALDLKHRLQCRHLETDLLAGSLFRFVGDDEFQLVRPDIELIRIQHDANLFLQRGFRHAINHDLGGGERRLPAHSYRDFLRFTQHRLRQQGADHGDFRGQGGHFEGIGDIGGIAIDIARGDRQFIRTGGHQDRIHRGAIHVFTHHGIDRLPIQGQGHFLQIIIGGDVEGESG